MNAAVKFMKDLPQAQHSLGFRMLCEEDQPPRQGYKQNRSIDETSEGKSKEKHMHKSNLSNFI